MSSINTLVGTFSSVGSNYEVVPDELIAIDTSNNRLGINTIDPSYTIHVKDSTDSSGTIFTSKLIVNNEIFYNPDKIDPSLQNFDGITYNNLIYDLSNSTSNNFTKDDLQSGTLDLSFQNIDICGSLSVNSITINGDNVVLQNQFDTSFDNIYTKSELQSGTLDLSFENLDICGSLSVQNSITVNSQNVVLQNQFDSSFGDVHTKGYIDTSFSDVDTRLDNIDLSLNNIDISLSNIDLSLNNVNTRLDAIDNSYSTIEISDNIIGIDVSKGFITFDSSYLYVRITNSNWGRIDFTHFI